MIHDVVVAIGKCLYRIAHTEVVATLRQDTNVSAGVLLQLFATVL